MKQATKTSSKIQPITTMQFIVELLLSFAVASVLSGLLWAILAFIVGNLVGFDSETDDATQVFGWIRDLSYAVFGLILGYRLHALIMLRRPR